MLRLLSRGLLIAALSLAYVAFYQHPALAAGEDDDDEEGGDDEGGHAKKGGDDEGDEEGEGEDEDAKDQPPVTAGGLFTMKTYPVREISRPLTLTKDITQLRLALGTDVSDKGAFGTFGLSAEAIYGYADNFNIIGGVTDAYNFKQFGIYAGFEGALYYDLVDIRVAANLHRNAIAEYRNFCSPVAQGDPEEPAMPLVNPMQCKAKDAKIVNLPDGNYAAGDMQFSIDLGFPFRYAIKPEIAIVALQTLMSIDFNQASVDHAISETHSEMDPTTMMAFDVIRNVPVSNKIKPDLKPSLGIATNPVPPLSVVIFGQLRIPDFDTSAGAFQIPVTARVEFSPNQKFDIGLEFTLLNVKPPDGQSPFLNRFLSLFMQSRFGK